jgi:hypothetical protein
MSREAMQMALEALEDANDVARMEFSDEDYYSEAINALRQALVDADDTSQERVDETVKREHEWAGLTDDVVFELADTNLYEGGKSFGVLAFARSIEQALKEKNKL